MKCTTCGNDFDQSFTVVTHDGTERNFDCFECAIHALAPWCANCECRIIGHGIGGPDDEVYCCEHCAQEQGVAFASERAS